MFKTAKDKSSKSAKSDTAMPSVFDLLDERWEIQIKQPLPQFSNELCKAYAVIDQNNEFSNIYALIGYNGLPFRQQVTEIMQDATIQHLVRCHATGPVTLSGSKTTHRAYIFDRPKGKPLSEILQHTKSLPDAFIIKQIIQPLSRVIMELEAQGVNHGNINTSSIYFDKEITLTECASLPSGYLQKTTYEAPDRLLCMPGGKGGGETSCDYYAMGILTLHLYLGFLPKEKLEKAALVEELLKQGAYNAFIPEVEFSDLVQDLLRGTINENRLERWNSGHIRGWITGKRYTVLPPSIPRDSVRPFDYRKQQYYTRSHIAFMMTKDWKMAKAHLSGYSLMRWLESNVKKTDVCAQVDRIIPIGDDETSERPLKDDELARLLTTLDPQAPVRYRTVSLNVDAIGPAFAEAFRSQNQNQIQQLKTVVEQNLLAYADRLLEGLHNPDISTILWRVQALRPILRAKAVGFGNERLLYQLNPSLSCQSNMLSNHYCFNLAETMETLDKLAAKHAKTTDIVDRHIAAFLTSRLDVNREVKVVELSGIGDMANDERLIMLKILAMAQQKMRNKPLHGITNWAVETVLPILNELHQTSKKESMKQKVYQLAEKGILERVAFPLFNREMFEYDKQEYSRAQALYRFHHKMLAFLQDNGKLRLKARIIGQQTAWFIGIITLIAVAYSSTGSLI